MPDVPDEVWAGIVRVSHVGARGGDSFHADREQVADVQRYAARRGAHVEFMDPELSVSGGLPIEQRPSLQAAIEGVEAGRYTGVVVAYLSRLTRSRSGIDIWTRVEAAGGSVHCAAEDLDTSTPNGRFIRDIHLANAVREREEHVERFAMRKRVAVEQGIWSSRVPPTGYLRDPATRRLVPDPERADAVRRAFEDRAAGTSVAVIARALGMTTSGVRNLLRNRAYLGEVRVGANVNPDAHPALITRSAFDAVQGDRIPQPGKGRNAEPAFLAGLVRCRSCGHRMVRHRGRSYDSTTDYYVCKKNHSAGHACPAGAAVQSRRLDEYVSAIARAYLEHYLTEVGSRGHGHEASQRARDKQDELDAYLTGVSAAAIGAERFAAGAAKRQAELDDALADLRQYETLSASPPGAAVIGGAAAWDALSDDRKRLMLRGILEVVVVDPAGPRGRWRPLEDRVRCIAVGSGFDMPVRRGEVAMGLHPLEWPAPDDERVLRELLPKETGE